MDKQAGQTPFTDEELTQALLRGTDEAARRQDALWSAIASGAPTPERRRPLWQTLAACGAAVILLVAAVWALGNQLPAMDIARPLASGIQGTPDVYLNADIQYYSPMLSSARGITISAHDSQGIPLPGDWSASWGVFLRPVGESANTLKYAIEALWTFPIGSGGSGDIPQSITITFSAPGHTPATMQLERQRDTVGFVHVVQKLDALNLRVNYPGYNANPYRNVVSPPITVEAVDAVGNPVSGDWKTTFGRMSGPARNLSDTRVADDSRVLWSFEAVTADDIPAAAAITFIAPNGRTRTLHLFKDPDNLWSLRVAPEEILYIPMAPATTHPVEPTVTPEPVATSESASPGLTAQQTVEAYFEAWNQKDQVTMESHVLDSRKGTDYEFDKLKSVQLLDCTDETPQMKGAFSKDWYSNPADIAVFRARFQYECKDPNGACGGMTSGTYEMDYYLVKETADGPWVIAMWGNG